MFKYGSFRLFVIKTMLGITFFGISIIFFLSLVSYSELDPGFGKFEIVSNDYQIKNYFGLVGAYLASYLIILIGHLSFLFIFFLFKIGLQLAFGIKNRLLFFKLLSNIIGILLINNFFVFYSFNFLEFGIISSFIKDNLFDLINIFSNSYALVNLVFFITLAIGVFLLFFSFSIKLSWARGLLTSLKFLKYLKYLNIFKNLIKINRNSKKIKLKKSEPTINRSLNSLVQRKSPKLKKQLELNELTFSLPNISLLSKSLNKTKRDKELDKFNDSMAEKLETALSEYGVDGKIIGYKSGPIVTLFEFIPNPGIKSSKVIGLSDDIARAMSSVSARISSQPGKTSLGIEIPNKKRDGVLFGDLVDEEKFSENQGSITLALGKDISGEKIYADLEKMPHLLIAGTTGSGKSVGINTMILSILYRFRPNECKLILIDPKMLELSIYEDIPHLLTPVVTDPKKAVFALKWVVREMENRYKLMSSLNVKNIISYNKKVLQTISAGRKLFKEVQTGIDSDTKMPIMEKIEMQLEKMPYIVVVIDEMADLMMVAGKEVESLVQRLAQMARASGIHLITATQRPSVDVITGTIKANFPSRLSYKVASKFDSRTILNEMGAEQLLGSGDMLLLENGGNVKRLHGGFVSEVEVENVVKSIKEQATFDHSKEISIQETDINPNLNSDLISNNNDELYNKAVEIIVKQQKVSTSFIQRYLQIGYNRAARIVEKMEEDGIITEANNAGKRHVLKKD